MRSSLESIIKRLPSSPEGVFLFPFIGKRLPLTEPLYHDKIDKTDSLAFDFLPFYDAKSASFEEWFRGNRRASRDCRRLDDAFQRVAEGGCNPAALPIAADVESVEIARDVDVAESNDPFPLDCNEGALAFKRTIPFVQIAIAGGPCVDLRLFVVGKID